MNPPRLPRPNNRRSARGKMSLPYHRLADILFNRFHCATGSAAMAASGVLLRHIEAAANGAPMVMEDDYDGDRTPRASSFLGEWRTNAEGQYKPYLVTPDGHTALVITQGDLVNRGSWIEDSCGLVCYDGIKHQFMEAARDPDITAIVHDIESPGGEAIGCFETAAVIRQVAAVKPVISIANGMAASGGYALQSAGTIAVGIPSCVVGSIGVVMLHIDLSAYLESEGVKPTLIHAGTHKVDGNPFQPLPDEVRAKFQTEAETLRTMFVECVAAGRKNLKMDAIYATEAEVYIGEAAREIGLVDEIATIEEVVYALANPQARRALLGAA